MKLSRVSVRLVSLLGILLAVEVVAAESTRYVNDELIITLRAGQGSEYKIIKSLPSGTRLELLEEGNGTDFTKVRTKDGIEGWVRSWYLSKTPTAKLLLADAIRKAESLEAENKKLRASTSSSSQTNKDLKQQLDQLETDNAKLLKENNKLKDIAGRPIELESENRRLTAEISRITQENKILADENSELRQSSVQKWFIAGSGVLIVGIIFGLILPRLRRNRASSWH